MEAGKDNNNGGIFIAAYYRSAEREWRRTVVVGLAPGQGRGEIYYRARGWGDTTVDYLIEGWILIARRRRKGFRKAEARQDSPRTTTRHWGLLPGRKNGPQWIGMGVSFGGSERDGLGFGFGFGFG